MKKISVLFFLYAFLCLMAEASPVFRVRKTVYQSDGTTLNITRTGSNHIMYYVTDDGMPVFPTDNGDYCYALFGSNSSVEASNVIAHETSARTPMEQRYAQDCLTKFNASLKMRNLTRYGVGSTLDASVSCIGDVRVPVILAEFTDVSFQESSDSAAFSNHFNASAYTSEGGPGSVRDYFISQSDSAFRPTFDVLAKVKVSRERSYYGAHSGGSSDVRALAYISEAVDSAIATGVDFTPYKNKNGEVFVIVIYPGQGEHVSGDHNQLWASYYYSMSHTVKGLRFTSGLVMDELADYGNGEMFDGIGTFCHEFSHALGLPDLYNTNNAVGIFGMDAWDIMDYGQFCNLSHTPVGYSAYEREFMGWMKIDTLKNVKQTVTLSPLGSGKGNPRAYRIPNENDSSGNEYYILENRQKSDWFLPLYGEGMLVFHVDYSSSAWANNSVNNNASHQRMTIIPADNVLTPLANRSSFYKGDPFPGLTNNTELSSVTVPCDTAYKGQYMNIRLSNIHQDTNRNIIFDYQHPYSVDSLSVTNISESGFTLSWKELKSAQGYAVFLSSNDSIISSDTANVASIVYDNLNMNLEYTVSVVPLSDYYFDTEPVYIVVTGGNNNDVNRDGIVNSADVVSIYNYIADGETSGVRETYADVNRDRTVNTADATAVFNAISGNQ